MALNTIISEKVAAPLRRIKEGRFFYGWVIVGVSFICDAFSSGTGGYTLGLFFRPMSGELGWSRTTLTFAATVKTMVNGISGPVIGPLVDRFGARAIMIMGAIAAGFGFMSISLVSTPWHFYLTYGLIGALGVAEFGGFITSILIAKWFVRMRGRAMAIATMGVSTGGWALIPLASFLILNFGWRTTWLVYGLIILVLIGVPAGLLIKNTPESMGLRPDGDESALGGEGAASGQTPGARSAHGSLLSASEEVSWTLSEALRTPALWLLIPAFNLGGMGLSAILIHQIPYIESKGFSSVMAATIGTMFGFSAFISKPFWGFMVERIHVRYCVIWAYMGAAAGLLVLIKAQSVPALFFYAIVFGLHVGAMPIMNPVAWANYFGRTFLGTIRGVVAPFSMGTGAISPLFAAWVYDSTGSYDVAAMAFMATYVIGSFFMFLARQPQHPTQRSKPTSSAEIT